MPNPYGMPEISAAEVARKRTAGESFVWLDVREPHEHALVKIDDAAVTLLPLSELAQKQLAALPAAAQAQSAEIVVFCHHGVRSAQVVAWLRQQGWSHVLNMAGGIDAWAREVDAGVGRY